MGEVVRVHVIETDNWVGLYLNGKLLRQGHSLDIEEIAYLLCEGLGLEHKVTAEYLSDEEWAERFPLLECPDTIDMLEEEE